MKRRKGWRMSCDVGEVFRHFTYVTTHSPALPSLYLRDSSFSNPSIASCTSQFLLQPFFRFSYVTSSSLTTPGEPPMSQNDMPRRDSVICEGWPVSSGQLLHEAIFELRSWDLTVKTRNWYLLYNILLRNHFYQRNFKVGIRFELTGSSLLSMKSK